MNNLILNRKIMLRTCAIAVGVALLGGCGSFMRSDFEPPRVDDTKSLAAYTGQRTGES